MRLHILILILTLSACATAHVTDEPQAWRLVEMGSAPVLADRTPTLILSHGQAYGTGGCNQFTAVYGESDGRITISDFSMMLLGCGRPPPLGIIEQEERYFHALQGTTRVSFANGDMVLRRDDGVTLRFVPQPN